MIGELCRDLPAPPLDSIWPSVLAPIAPDLERRLGRVPGRRVRASPELERARLFEAIVALLDWACLRPVVLVLEDVHLADTSRLVRELTSLPAGEVDEVVTAAEGNPLIAVEWSRALSRGEHGVPASLRGAVRAALAPLAGDELMLARFAAAAGRELSREEIGALPLRSPAIAAAGALECGLLLAARGRIGYRHALLREAVYSDLPEPLRARLHQDLAAALSRGEGQDGRLLAEIARHLRLAGRDDLAALQLARAAAHARAVAALAEAAAFLEEAIELAPDDVEIAMELAEVEAWRGREEASDMAFERALPALQQVPEQLARALVRRTNWYRGALCHPRRVLESARHAVEVLDSAVLSAAETRGSALAAWAWAEAVAGDAEAADMLLGQVDTVLGQRPVTDMLAHLVGQARAFSLIRRSRFEESYGPLIAAAAAARRAGRPDLSYGGLVTAACAAACAGDFERALEFIDRGMADLAGTGLATLEVQYLAARAQVLIRTGRLSDAREASESQRLLAERLDNPALQAISEH